MPDVLQELNAFVEEFNALNKSGFAIDSIRIDFNKQHKLEKLQKIGRWEKIGKHSNILHKLKKRLHNEELTSAYRLEGMDVYFYNLQDPPKYRRARMVVFGLSQYHKEPIPDSIVKRVLNILKDVTNIDICFDTDRPPNLDRLAHYFSLHHYKGSSYINAPLIPMVERIVFYDKRIKNALGFPLWRMEATVTIPNWKVLAIPLLELQEIAGLAYGKQNGTTRRAKRAT